MDNLQLNLFNYKNTKNNKYFQIVSHSITLSLPFDSYVGDPAIKYMSVLVFKMVKHI